MSKIRKSLKKINKIRSKKRSWNLAYRLEYRRMKGKNRKRPGIEK